MSIKNIKKTSNLGSSAKKTQLYIVCHLENDLEIFSCNSHFTELGLRHCDKRQRDNATTSYVLVLRDTLKVRPSELQHITTFAVMCSESAFILSEDPNPHSFCIRIRITFILSEDPNPHSFCLRLWIRIHFVSGSESAFILSEDPNRIHFVSGSEFK